MPKTQPITHCFTPEDLHLFELPQIFTACSVWYESGMKDNIATFDLTVREMPKNRNFLLMGGTEEIVTGINEWSFTKDEIAFLLENRVITPGFAEYLKDYRFKGEVLAMPEGTVFFPGEPVVRITGTLIECNLISMFMLNSLTSNTTFLSKAVRGIIAAGDKAFISSAGMRAQSNESAFKYGRATEIVGGVGSSCIASFARKFSIPFEMGSNKIYHAVIKSFPTEIDAFRTFTKIFPGLMGVMVDTYDFDQGVKNAITVEKEKPGAIADITIDSGNLLSRAQRARKMLDEAGLKNITITAASNLDEWKIQDLIKKNAPIDKFLVVTEMISCRDAPTTEVVYKLAEIRDENGIHPKAKLAPGKESYPGRKQVFRILKNGKMEGDFIGLEDEKLGEPLLKTMIKDGKLVGELPLLPDIKAYVKEQLVQLPKPLLSITEHSSYTVSISDNLTALFEEARKKHV